MARTRALRERASRIVPATAIAGLFCFHAFPRVVPGDPRLPPPRASIGERARQAGLAADPARRPSRDASRLRRGPLGPAARRERERDGRVRGGLPVLPENREPDLDLSIPDQDP